MSEVTTAAPTAEAVAPVATPEVPQQNAAEIRADVKARASGKVASHHSATQPRDVVGKFASDGEPNPEAAAPVPAEPASTEPAKASVKDRIELPPNDPLRARGKQYFDELAPHEVQSIINRANRVAELETQTRELTELRAQLARESAAKDAWREQTSSVLQNPEVAQIYATLKEANPTVADQWLKGVQSEHEGAVATKLKEVDASLAQEREEAESQQFLSSTREASSNRYPAWWTQRPEFNAAFQRAAIQYATELEFKEATGQAGGYDQNSFFEYMDRLFLADPYAMTKAQEIKAQRDAEARKAAEQEVLRKQQEDAVAHQQRLRSNPLARIPAAANTDKTTPVQTELTNAERRQQIRDRARGTVRQ